MVLTAGRGTRMRSSLPKVLHPIAGLPMIDHVVRAAQGANAAQIILTIGPTSEALRSRYDSTVELAWQPEPLGTGDAVAVALPLLGPHIEWVLVIYGDHPLIDSSTLANLMSRAIAEGPILALLTFDLADPGPYGRFRFGPDGRIIGTVEAVDDTSDRQAVTTVNSGMCAYRRDWLEGHIGRLPLSPKGEYYLTGLVEMAAASRWPVNPVIAVPAPVELALGVNDRAELAEAERLLRERINRRHMLAGVSIVDPASTFIDVDVEIGNDTRIEPGCMLRGSTGVGSGCVIGPGSVIEDSIIGDDCRVMSSWLEQARVGAGVTIGPYAHLRPGAIVGTGARIGNFAEIKNATLGSQSHMHHFGYVGDAHVGARVNIGAGVVVCNYDGREKHHTEIGDDVFVGSDTLLIAPVALGAGSSTGAGSVVTRSVAPGAAVRGVPARVVPRPESDGSG
ncbi:MAG: UDP-N-acetylglucosamine diphosphorylase/glucosamine-1-phosphate N-acetyltransferase [Chloroflexi bacterium]|nr:MAG: UDP-N-acetylglucosamine diphosphorylase/glucosamine-1-phosphate N-acetyltransferase [Chloroflexota bacterium]